jgi:hypothetical protein
VRIAARARKHDRVLTVEPHRGRTLGPCGGRWQQPDHCAPDDSAHTSTGR